MRFREAGDHDIGIADGVSGGGTVSSACFGREFGSTLSGAVPDSERGAGGGDAGGHRLSDGAESEERRVHGENISLYAEARITNSKTMKTVVRIEGMTCQHCVRAVFTALA